MTAYVVARDEKDLKKFAQAIAQLAQGRSNAVGTVTLAAGATQTTVASLTCASGSVILLSPVTAHAAAELAAGGCFISAVGEQTFTIAHANNAQTDRTFGYVCLV
jgi:hypothetical protein